MQCSNCNKELKHGEREIAEKQNHRECAECQFHAMNGTRTIERYNEWLRKSARPSPAPQK
jgi:DNA-directed RNA polymerase subunit RPC12/RpoP